jgi:hypothetical protein
VKLVIDESERNQRAHIEQNNHGKFARIFLDVSAGQRWGVGAGAESRESSRRIGYDLHPAATLVPGALTRLGQPSMLA